jgi:hypothetical protein
LTDADALLAGTLNSASYHWIKPLGIIAPSEGKNRTDFLRGEGVELIPANVWEHTYPAAERLQIYEIEDGAFKETWAVLDGRWVQKVENPSWTNPLMQAYGVPVQQRWPRQFPSPKQVVLAMFERPGTTSPMGHPDHDYAPFVDLKTLEAISQYQTEEVRCAVLELKDIQIDRRIWACITTSFILGFLIWTLAPSAWTPLQGLAGVFVGIGLGGLAIFLKGVVTTDRRNLSNQIRLPLDRAPKSPKHIARRLLG